MRLSPHIDPATGPKAACALLQDQLQPLILKALGRLNAIVILVAPLLVRSSFGGISIGEIAKCNQPNHN